MRRLREIAEAATPGPWRWGGYVKGPMYLATVDRGRRFIMGFGRLGMQGAQPTFQVYDERGNGRMVPASELAVREAEHRDDIIDIDNPDARFIAAADPSVVLALLDVAGAAKAVVEAHDEADSEQDWTGPAVNVLLRDALHGLREVSDASL